MRFVMGLLVLTVFTGVSVGEEIFPGKKGSELRKLLRENYTPSTPHSYTVCRKLMFGIIDNNDGKVELAYTTELFPINASNPIPDHTIVNTEHTWPQSKFGHVDGPGMKTDIHHLFPCRSPVNTERGNKPFAEIPDMQMGKWWNGPSHQTLIPTQKINEFSESTGTQFEPEEDHKGNVARAMVYFFTIYENNSNVDKNFFYGQVPIFKSWHVADKSDDREIDRSKRIEEVQGNINPFVVDETLLERALDGVVATSSSTPPMGTVAAPGISPTPAVGTTDSINGVSILAILPNPVGQDEGHETVTLGNSTEADINIADWKLTDKAGREFKLSGKIAAGESRSIKLVDSEMILGNNGGEVSLFDKSGAKLQTVSYTKEQAKSGAFIVFGG